MSYLTSRGKQSLRIVTSNTDYLKAVSIPVSKGENTPSELAMHLFLHCKKFQSEKDHSLDLTHNSLKNITFYLGNYLGEK